MYYLFKYGSSYYEKNHNFQLVDSVDKIKHKSNIEKTKNAILSIDEFQEHMKYDNTPEFNQFISNIQQYSTVKELLDNYKFTDNECNYLEDFLNFLLLESPHYKIIPLHIVWQSVEVIKVYKKIIFQKI